MSFTFMLTGKSTKRTSQLQMKKKGTALLAGFFPQYIHVKKFSIEGDLQNQAKITIAFISDLRPGFRAKFR